MRDGTTFQREKAGLYVHIPFCVQKCIYCDFNSVPDCSHRLQSEYFEGLKREIGQFWKSLCREESFCGAFSDDGTDRVFADTLFLGGGTPSSVDPALIEELMRYIRAMKSEGSGNEIDRGDCVEEKGGCERENDLPQICARGEEYTSEGARYLLSGNAEITMEVNPATVDYDSLVRYRRAGINRLSIGVQSFQDEELKFLGRIHTAGEAECCFTMARRAGFENINIDLIFGIPGSTADSWKSTLRRAVALRPDHLSFYSLQIEEGTPLYRMFRSDDIQQVSDEENRRMYHDAVQFLEQVGYHQYEISNAALAKRECRHNLKYWSMCDYAGFGVSAHSYLNAPFCEAAPTGGIRFFNEDDIFDYLRRIDETEEKDRGYLPFHIYQNTLRDEISEALFTGLRKKRGISLSWFDERFRNEGVTFLSEFGEKMKPFIEEGYLIFDGKSVRFSLKGFDLSNYILAELI